MINNDEHQDDAHVGLTLYDLHRQPRATVTDDSKTTVQIRNLNIELTCPVCLGILHETMTVMECLHRFCSGCISKCLRLGKKECPACRVKCSSRRHLRPDPNFDAIIAAIYPNLEAYEAKEESMIEEITKNIIQSGNLIESVEQGKKRQALAKAFRGPVKKKPKKPEEITKPPKPVAEPPKNSNTANPVDWGKNAEPSPTRPEKNDEISFVLLVNPGETLLMQLQNRFLRTSRRLHMKHLGRFMQKKFESLDLQPSQYKFSLTPGGKILGDDVSLDYIEKEMWKKKEELVLYYRSVV